MQLREWDKNVSTRKATSFPLDEWVCASRVYRTWTSEEAGRREKDHLLSEAVSSYIRLKHIRKPLHKCSVHTQINKLQLSNSYAKFRSGEKCLSKFSNAFFLKQSIKVINNSAIPGANEERGGNMA